MRRSNVGIHLIPSNILERLHRTPKLYVAATLAMRGDVTMIIRMSDTISLAAHAVQCPLSHPEDHDA